MPESAPQPSMTLDQVREAYQRGDKELLNTWYLQRQEQADRDPTSVGRFELSVDLARVHLAVGEVAEARESISGTNIAIQEELIEIDRHDSPAFARVDKEAYRAKLKTLLQNVTYLRSEIMK